MAGAVALPDVADVPPHGRRVRDDVHARDRRGTGGRPDQRGEHPHRGRLAGAVRAEHGDQLAGSDVEVDAAHGVHGLGAAHHEVLGESSRLDHGFSLSSGYSTEPGERSGQVLSATACASWRHVHAVLPTPVPAVAAAGAPRLAGRGARGPARRQPAHRASRRRPPARARLPRARDQGPRRRLPARRRHPDAAAPARRRAGGRPRRGPADRVHRRRGGRRGRRARARHAPPGHARTPALRGRRPPGHRRDARRQPAAGRPAGPA